jgi:hypothetical protein
MVFGLDLSPVRICEICHVETREIVSPYDNQHAMPSWWCLGCYQAHRLFITRAVPATAWGGDRIPIIWIDWMECGIFFAYHRSSTPARSRVLDEIRPHRQIHIPVDDGVNPGAVRV